MKTLEDKDFQIAEWKHEVSRLQSILRNPDATQIERRIASEQLRYYICEHAISRTMLG